jgi:tyrosyl-tRNA synthetase
MTRLSDSVARASALLAAGDLASDQAVEELLTITGERRAMDLSDLDGKQQAELIASRSVDVLPTSAALAEAVATAGRPLRIKFGIDPTGAEVHLGHAVPMILLSRFQRMGHQIVLIIGDITAKIGDPSGRSAERPPLTDADIAENLSSYRAQISPFFDFTRAEYRHNSEWLAEVKLPELIGILSRIPVSASLQREDFRSRLAEGHGLAMSELMYSVVMAIDSAKVVADVEIGGVDQLLNMQMGRKVMEIVGQPPQLVVANPLIEGTDGTGAKMSKSLGNHIPLTAPAEEIFGKVMSIPDRLTVPYLKAWSEWTDPEIALAEQRLEARTLHPMDVKKVLAGEATAAIHGVAAAMAARRGFTAQFSARSFGDVESMPVLTLAEHGAEVLGAVLTGVLGFTASVSAARRLAKQNGLRLVIEDEQGQRAAIVDEPSVLRPMGDVAAEALGELGVKSDECRLYLKAGRKVARVDPS